ncbi:DUF4180 domain-containing protein [Saccharopolyspora sp. 6V]|nr:DUF4180 domain-containing protein [Saccharopolyspora sp. 6V]MCA1195866.1 DUF4180 domain-containing protein [Saccharopolyspora sp. 6V]
MPVGRFAPEFFSLGTGSAGQVLQKFATCARSRRAERRSIGRGAADILGAGGDDAGGRHDRAQTARHDVRDVDRAADPRRPGTRRLRGPRRPGPPAARRR